MGVEDGADAAAGEQPEPLRPGRESSREWRAHQTPAVLAQALKERVYATFTGLAIVLVLRAHEPTPQDATFSLVIGVLGITVAGFAAEVIAHLAAHASFPDRDELGRMLRIASGAFASVGVPVLLLLCSWLHSISVEAAPGQRATIISSMSLAARRRAPSTFSPR